MEEPLIKKLPLGTSSFLALRNANQIYVEKSEYIFKLASIRAQVFLSRPRRFGKSLLVSTFEALFKNGIRDFKGLAIEKKWKDDKKYTVVRLDFSETRDFENVEEFSQKLTSLLARKFRSAGFSYQEDSALSVTEQLSNWLQTQPVNQLVILIDEYDAPLTVCLDSADEFEYVSRKLTEFYAVLKTNGRALRFLFITGITKFNKTCLFAELNDLSDISLSPDYGALLGFTREEVQKIFWCFP
ncbi:AAA family ATPase [Turicimonas muris]|uniref:AAA family ATPase n=2 Tax=Turicimonas muris TaxID=1796652 RepID=UPI000AB21FB3|nr:AAA family ATPase [Turicimonas muris]